MSSTSPRSDCAGGATFGSPPQSHLSEPATDAGSSVASTDPSPSSTPDPTHEPFRLRAGTHLLGRYEGSAYEQPTYLVRRDDGQVIHLSHLLYLVAELLDGERDLPGIAEKLSVEIGRPVVADNVEYLVEQKLRPSGLIAAESDVATALPRTLPLLALRFRRRVIPARLHQGITTALQPLFWPPIVLLVLGALVAVNIWLFGTQHASLLRAARQLAFHPNLFLLVTVLVIFSGFFHELGHATATRYGGGSPGVMGVGIYIAWPAFYTDLTDSYRLNRTGRLRADLGGVYFNAVLIVAAGAAYLMTGFGPLAVAIVVSQAMAMYQFLPFIRLDGYYIMSDLVGVPNLFDYLGPVLASMFRRPDPVMNARLHLLKPRARLAIKVWSVVTVAFLAFNFVFIAILAPIMIPAEWASIHLQAQAMAEAFARENVAVGINDFIDLLLIAIAPVGLLLIAGLLLRRAIQAIKKWWPTRPKVAAALAVVLVGVLLFQGQGLISRLEASSGPSGPPAAAKGARPVPPVAHVPGSSGVTPAFSSSTVPVVASYAAVNTFYVVQPGDTLWGIAAERLGDPERWTAIFDLNAGVPQPDGRTLVEPDLIYPGWKLELPSSQPTAAIIPTPSQPVGQTAAVVIPASQSPPEPIATSTSPTAPAAVSPATSGSQPDSTTTSPSPASITTAESPGGPPTSGGGTTTGGGGKVGAVRGQSPTTTQPSTATKGCALSRGACPADPEDSGDRGRWPPAPAATIGGWVPPVGPPAAVPPGSPAQPRQPGDEGGNPDAATGHLPIGVPDERSPPGLH
jgi:putative peptide zinc metalloprotease protein